nr:integrase, catalytic region, zinc finger, CCHC-type, peptidase aspartic, catalytic [Tanacetum cinerariifolium]
KNENVELEFQVLTNAKENAHLKTTHKNLFDSISLTRTRTKTIIDSLQNKLHDTIYENAKLRAQLFDKVLEQKDTTRGTSANTKFAKQSILRKPPSSSKTKLYAVTPIPKSMIYPKVGVDNTAKTRRPQPRSNTKNDRVSSTSKSSCIKNKEVKVEENLGNLLLSKNKNICHLNQCLISVNHDVCLLNYVNDMNSRGMKQKKNVSINEHQKKQTPKFKKPTNVGLNERLATPKPSKPRFFLRWSPTGRFFDLKGKIIASTVSESQSVSFNGDNACTSNPLKSKIKRFPNSTSFLGSFWELFTLHVAAILGFGDLQWVNILITRVYFVEGLGYNLFSVGQFCDSDLEKKAGYLLPICIRALCYPKNDRKDIGKLGAKGDIGFFIGYSADSCAYRVYNRGTKKIIETMNVTFDKLLAMAFE